MKNDVRIIDVRILSEPGLKDFDRLPDGYQQYRKFDKFFNPLNPGSDKICTPAHQ